MHENFKSTAEFKIKTTCEHEKLNAFYAANDLEISEDEPVSTDTVKSWVIMKDDALGECQSDPLLQLYKSTDINQAVLGACTLALREGEYIIDGIALTQEARGLGAGTALLKAAEDEIRHRGGQRIFLVARAPEFFRLNGYETVERGDAPEFFECFGCDQYNISCFPEVMMHVL